jgi:hypothetical protein
VVGFEKERRLVSLGAVEAIRAALERAGIEFIDENGGRGRPSASKAAASKAKIAPPYFFINIPSKARLVPSKPPASAINRVKGAYGCLASQLPYNPPCDT